MSNYDIMNEEEKHPIHLYFIYLFTIITVAFILLRILLNFFLISEWIQKTKDIDFYILIGGMENGLVDFYNTAGITHWPPYYLYFWYFIFYPFYLLNYNTIIAVYIWDFLRLFLTIIVIKESPKVFKDKKDLLIFYILSLI